MARAKQEKSPMIKFSIMDFMKQFPDETTCLEWLKDYRYPNGITCPKCESVTKHHLVSSRKSYSCQECGKHTHPTADTIYHKSSTSLTIWFYTVYLMASTRCGVSAKHIERETGVTYKTAWRMCKLIREALDEDHDPFGGTGKTVEIDESYFGPKTKLGKRGLGSENKKPVLGIVERKGKIKAKLVSNARGETLIPMVKAHVEKGATINTDEWGAYNKLNSMGYDHDTVKHGQKQYVKYTPTADVHTNTIEGFWGNFKMGIKGNHHHISFKHLDKYLAEWSFRYNHRMDEKPMFWSMLQMTTAER